MTITTYSSREFNQNSSGAKQSALNGPVFITDRGKPSFVLLSIEDYRKLTHESTSIVDLLATSEVDEIDFDPPKLSGKLYRPADLS